MNKELKIVTWNLGYGVYPDYYAITGSRDSIRNMFPISKKEVKKNIAGQITVLKQIDADILLLQEVTSLNPVNRWTNQFRLIKKGFQNYSRVFIPSVNIPGVLKIGKCTITKIDSKSEPLDAKFKATSTWDNLVMRNNVSVLTRTPLMDKELVTINIHLAPFKRQSELREQQLRFIFDVAAKEYEKGNYVIIGGDWNMDMPLTKLPLKYKTIMSVIPDDLTEIFDKKRWQLMKASEATVRDLKAPYPNTEMNSIDGFLCSPNIKVFDIKIIQDFRYSDHCPVLLKIGF